MSAPHFTADMLATAVGWMYRPLFCSNTQSSEEPWAPYLPQFHNEIRETFIFFRCNTLLLNARQENLFILLQ